MTKGIVRSPALVIVLSVITCGIYAIYWLYKASEEIKNYLEMPELNPLLDTILSIICFPYIIYWSYKYGKLILEAQQKADVKQEDNAVLYLVLSIFGLFIINMAIMQASLNSIWEK